jgi:uncharacterized protein (DUF305 family)
VKGTVVKSLVFVVVFVVTVVLPGLPQGSHPHKNSGDEHPGWSSFQDSMEQMHTQMASVEPSGDTDIDFVKLMEPHHQAAIEMAKAELIHGHDAQLRRLAQEIITDQQSELELMQRWLKQHSQGFSIKEGTRENN